MVQQNCQEETTNSVVPTVRREQLVRSEDLSAEIQGESGVSQAVQPTDDAEARTDFWSTKVTSSIVITMNLEFNSMCRKKKHSRYHWNTWVWPWLLRQIWMCCKQIVLMMMGIRTWIEDYQKPPKGFMWSGERPTKLPENLWSEVWSKMGKAAQKKERQEWANEKAKLDNARRSRGIYFTDPEDGELKETIKNARESWKFQWMRRCFAKKRTKKHSGLQESQAKNDESNKIPKTQHARAWKHTSPRERVWNHLYRKVMKITSQARDIIWWVTKIWHTEKFQCLERWKFWMRKQHWTKNGRSSKRFDFAQFYRVWNHFSGCQVAYGWVTCSWSLGHSIQAFRNWCHSSFQNLGPESQKKTAGWWIEWCGSCAHQHTFFPRWVSVVHFEDNEAVIKMIIKERSPTMRHVCLEPRELPLIGCLTELTWNPKIQSKYVNTKNQLADILTKGSFSRDESDHLFCLVSIMNFPMCSSSHFSDFLSDD